MTTHYTDSKGNPVEIATMPYPHLKSAHRKAIGTEERKHEASDSYTNPAREAEIDAMKAEIDRRDAAYAEQQADAIDAGEGFRPR
jgi:hypothetical protein